MILKNNIKRSTKMMVVFSYLIMILVNILANLLPLNGVTTGAVSNAYPNLFAPAGITFLIWGVIYFLLFLFILYYLGFFNQVRSYINPEVFNRIGVIFSVLSIANAIWLFTWHWEIFWLSNIIILLMLGSLIIINQIIKNEKLTKSEKLFLKLPFSVYFGWITVATIANVTTYLISSNWDGFGLTKSTWTIIIIIVGMLIGTTTTLINKDVAYGLVLIWSYIGIFIKHISSDGLAGQYPSIMITIIISIIIFVLSEAYLIFNKNPNF